jgi:hypothetical protein
MCTQVHDAYCTNEKITRYCYFLLLAHVHGNMHFRYKYSTEMRNLLPFLVSHGARLTLFCGIVAIALALLLCCVMAFIAFGCIWTWRRPAHFQVIQSVPMAGKAPPTPGKVNPYFDCYCSEVKCRRHVSSCLLKVCACVRCVPTSHVCSTPLRM